MELGIYLSRDFGKYFMFLLIVFGVSGWIENHYLIKLGGKIKRGFRIWSKPLPDDVRNYLYDLTKDIVEYRKIGFSSVQTAFIRTENNEIIIQFRKPRWSAGWPCVGYIDLSAVEPQLEYRSSLLAIMPILFISLLIILQASSKSFIVLFFVIIMYVNYLIETKAIDGFIKEKMGKWQAQRIHDLNHENYKRKK